MSSENVPDKSLHCMSRQSKLTRSPSLDRDMTKDMFWLEHKVKQIYSISRENGISNGGVAPDRIQARMLPTISMHINNHSSSTAIRLLHPSGFVPLVFI